MLKMQVINRVRDGLPLLKIEATDAVSKRRLTALYDQMQLAQWEAIPRRMADIHNVCGSLGDSKGINEVVVGLLLGGAKVAKRRRNRV